MICSISSWHQLKKVVAVFLRIEKILRDRIRACLSVNDKTSIANCYSTLLSAEDLAQPDIAIVKFIQSAAFPKEITCLSNIKSEDLADYWKFQKSKKLSMKRISSIHRLDPYFKNGILRVGGRLNCAELLPETAHPTILPYKNHVTTLIIRHLHRHLGHVGHNHVIAAIREKYWVIKVNATV